MVWDADSPRVTWLLRKQTVRRVGALVMGVSCLYAHCVTIAQAEVPRLVSYGTFPHATDGALGIAVDQSSDNVFTTGFFEYNAEGAPIGLGSDQEFDAAGAPISQPFGAGAHYGIAVNPVNDHLYIANALTNEIEVDEADGTPVPSSPSFTVPPFGSLGVVAPAEIATDSEGHVYVPSAPNDEVTEYSENGMPIHTFTGLDEPTGVAVDSSGDVWVADRGANRIEELSPAGTIEDGIESEGVAGVAVNAQGDVLALVDNSADFCGSLAPPCEHLVEYSTAGAQVADIGAGDFGSPSGTSPLFNMLAVNEMSGRVYVADDDKQNLVWIFGPPSAPRIESELAIEVGASEAKLGALVNPGGVETKYRIEYDTREYHEGEDSHGVSVPFPEGSAGQGVTGRTVWADAAGLTPGTTYHYRVIATNVLGRVVGADHTFRTETSVEASCPNEQFRGGFSEVLPDCRAYELVTAPNDASAEPEEGGGVAASEGNRVSYTAIDVQPNAQSAGEDYLATRGASGWSSEDVIPLQSYTAECAGRDARVTAFSSDLSRAVVFDGAGGRASAHGESEEFGVGGCDAEGLEVVAGEPVNYKNLLLRDNLTGSYQLLNPIPSGMTPADASFQGASADLSHVLFTERAQLTANAPAGADDLYEWSEAGVHLVTVLPNGVAVDGSVASERPLARAISADGSRVFFDAGGKLYVRLDSERTVQVDEAHGGPGPGGGGSFWDASANGSEVLFTDEAGAGLTSNTISGSGANLYLYDIENGGLTDLTPAGHAEVEGVVGIGEGGSYVYYVAAGSLAAGGTQGQPNLYVWHNGVTTFITTLALAKEALGGNARVSPTGAYLAFDSTKSLTGYDNNGLLEVFLYDASSNQLICASCNPSGQVAVYGTEAMVENSYGAPHYLSNGGRLFFDTREALLPRDTDGQINVYEYEGGQLYLISAGTSSSESILADASENGDNIFFFTRQKLVPSDTDEEARSLYDARIDGGFPESFTVPPCSTEDACRAAPTPQPSIYGAPASQTFSGAGNLVQTPKSKAKTRSKPAKCRDARAKKKRCIKKPGTKKLGKKRLRKSARLRQRRNR